MSACYRDWSEYEDDLLFENAKLETETCRLRDEVMRLAKEADVYGDQALSRKLREIVEGAA